MNDLKRMNYIDSVKGIGIFLVVLGHCYTKENFITIWLNSFHMPLFFIIVGYILRYKEIINDNLSFNLKNRLKNIGIPYIFFGICISLFLATLSQQGEDNFKITFLRYIKSLVTLKGVQALWFLPCLFISEYIFILVLNANINYKVKCLILGTLFITTLTFSSNISNLSFIVLPRVIIGMGFIFIGYLFYKIVNRQKFSLTSIVAINLIVFILSSFNKTSSTMYNLHFNNIIIYLFTSILGSLGMILIFKKFENVEFKWLKFYGFNSIIILVTHACIIEIIRLIDYRIFNNILIKLDLVGGIILSIIVMIIMIPIINIINNYFGFLIGRSSNKSKLNINYQGGYQ